MIANHIFRKLPRNLFACGTSFAGGRGTQGTPYILRGIRSGNRPFSHHYLPSMAPAEICFSVDRILTAIYYFYHHFPCAALNCVLWNNGPKINLVTRGAALQPAVCRARVNLGVSRCLNRSIGRCCPPPGSPSLLST